MRQDRRDPGERGVGLAALAQAAAALAGALEAALGAWLARHSWPPSLGALVGGCIAGASVGWVVGRVLDRTPGGHPPLSSAGRVALPAALPAGLAGGLASALAACGFVVWSLGGAVAAGADRGGLLRAARRARALLPGVADVRSALASGLLARDGSARLMLDVGDEGEASVSLWRPGNPASRATLATAKDGSPTLLLTDAEGRPGLVATIRPDGRARVTTRGRGEG